MDPCKETITVPVASPQGASRNSFPGMTDIGETPPAPNLFNFCVLCSHVDVRQPSLAEEETAGGDVCFCCGASSGAHSGDAKVPAQPASPGQGGPGRQVLGRGGQAARQPQREIPLCPSRVVLKR